MMGQSLHTSKNTKLYTCLNNANELAKSKIVNVAYDIKNIDPTLSLGLDMSNLKVYYIIVIC